MRRVTVLLVFALIAGAAHANPEMTANLPNGATMEFVWIEPGTFLMGRPDSDPWGEDPERPQHEVTISAGFWLGKYEITQGQWQAAMGTTPWQGWRAAHADPDHPAVAITWEDVQALAQRLSTAAGEEVYRLPTEAEWEYACRAGTTTRWSFGDDRSFLYAYGWYYWKYLDVRQPYAQPVGELLPNPWGLYDMHGNVWEYVQDWYAPYAGEPQVDPRGPATGSQRIFRGGAFTFFAEKTRSAYRGGHYPERRADLGARLLRTAPILPSSVDSESWGTVKRRSPP